MTSTASPKSTSSERPVRVRENHEYAAMVKRMIRAHGRRVAKADMRDLADLLSLRAELESVISASVSHLHDDEGYSWSEIGEGMGVTKQAAFQRYGKKAS
jgi:uncharacterized protein with PIN domain